MCNQENETSVLSIKKEKNILIIVLHEQNVSSSVDNICEHFKDTNKDANFVHLKITTV